MTGKIIWLGALFVVFLFSYQFSGAPDISAQVPETSRRQKDWNEPSFRVIRTSGWNLPTGKAQVPSKVSVADVNGYQVKKRLLPHHEGLMDFDGFYVNSSNEVKIFSQKCRVRTFISLEVNGRIFAYQVVYNLVGSGELHEPLGAVYNVFFLDQDGDGIFEERIQSTKMPVLPDWVKTLK